MTTLEHDAADEESPRGPKLWLAWGVAASGFVALAMSFGLTVAQAVAEPIAEPAAPPAAAESAAPAPLAAVVIGHPHPGTLEALERWIPDAQARGVVVAPVGVAVARSRDGALPEVAARS